MCGIVGYIGDRDCCDMLLDGLQRLEYRGYDSAGVAIFDGENIQVRKAKGRLAELRSRVEQSPINGKLGIGHTRWATHGEPSDVNSHPHIDMKGEIAIVHNGIIENYLKLKENLMAEGCKFVSETDTEVIAHLLNHFYEGDMKEAILRVIPMLQGSFGLGIISKEHPDEMYCVRKDSPLIIGVGKGENFIASDIPAILEHTRDIYLLDNGEFARVTREGVPIFNELGNVVEKDVVHIDWDVKAAEKGGYKHFMLKEIHEEAEAVMKTLSHYIDREKREIRQELMPMDPERIKNLEYITFVACGTAYYAATVGKIAMEKLCRIPVEVVLGSEFRYCDPIPHPGQLYTFVSQSGETADTIAALRQARQMGGYILSICNVVGSSLSREGDHVMYTMAGPEVAVASTKAYISQMALMYVLMLDIAYKKGEISREEQIKLIDDLFDTAEKCVQTYDLLPDIQRFAHQEFNVKHVFFMGRGIDQAVSLEASLKLKEISYIHSEAYAGGELKHGTIALIENGSLVVATSTQEHLFDKTISNIKEVKVRGAVVLGVVQESRKGDMAKEVDEVWTVPNCNDLYTPLLTIIPLHLFGYYMALEKDCDIDKPRNLAKSVTVE